MMTYSLVIVDLVINGVHDVKLPTIYFAIYPKVKVIYNVNYVITGCCCGCPFIYKTQNEIM